MIINKIIYNENEYQIKNENIIWNFLESNSEAICKSPHEINYFGSKIYFSVSMEIASEYNEAIGINDDGYIFINLFDSGKVYYVGEEKAGSLLN